jgi:subtilisin family serine protease
MKASWVLLVWTPLLVAQTIPNRYIVELSEEPVAAAIARAMPRNDGKLLLHGTVAEQSRLRIRTGQLRARQAIRQAQGRVLGSVENLNNLIFAEIPDSKAGSLLNIPGVTRIYPDRQLDLLLDHALPLHHVPEAWSQVGLAAAGAGMKIAIVDTGIDSSHPGFQDPGLPAVSGFPKANNDGDLAFTNSKVIVARSYADLFTREDPDPSPRDHVGHGTATAMAAAGVANTGPLAVISGVAPKAYVGAYKVFGSPGVNDQAPLSGVLKALDDATADGMDIISLSLGTTLAVRFEDDPEVQAVERAAALGIIVVASAGNSGPDRATVSAPATAPSAIAVGASFNDRAFYGSILLSANAAVPAVPGSGFTGHAPVSGPVADVARLDRDGQACSPFPPGSLANSIAFIVRGTCTFEQKLNNAQAGGAIGAIVYTDAARPQPTTMAVGSATLPAEMVSFSDGTALKKSLASPRNATLQFTLSGFYVNPAQLADFSASGPNVDYSIKPDLVAAGTSIYTATQSSDPAGVMFDATGYVVEDGTSFSAPLVAGAAALLKAARPGLSSAQYRSLLVNTASTLPLATPHVQQEGAGALDVLSAVNATAAASPVSLSFGIGGGTVNAVMQLTVSNIGTAADTFLLSVVPLTSGMAPALPFPSVRLETGASVSLPVSLAAETLPPGEYEGFISIQGTNSSIISRIPYWYGVSGGLPANITVLYSAPNATAGSRVTDAVIFRVTDSAGLPIPNLTPLVTVISGDAVVTAVRSRDSIIPNTFGISARLGPKPGNNVFHIEVGNLTKDVTVIAQ